MDISKIAGDAAKGAAGGMIGGPVGMIIGGLSAVASDLVPAIFGAETQPALAAAAQAITGLSGEPAQVTALAKDPAATEAFRLECLRIAADQQKADRQAQLDVMAATLEQHKVDIADTANARAMGVSYAKAGSKMQWAQPVVSVLVVVGFFVALVGVLLYRSGIDPVVGTIINVLIGVLASNFTQVCNFWLGSSSGSAEKTKLLANSVPVTMLPNPATIVPSADAPQ